MRNRRCRVFFRAFALSGLLLCTAVFGQSAPAFTKSFSPATIGPGSTTILTYRITNNSASPVTALAFTDNLPGALSVASPAMVDNGCLGTVSASGATISLSGGAVGGGESCRISVNATAATVGSHAGTSGALSSSGGSTPGAGATLVVAADRPGFSKSFAPASVAFGGRTRLTFTIDNSLSSAAANQPSFVDTLPSGLEVATPPALSSTCNGGVVTAAGGSRTISYAPQFFGDGSVAAGASCQIGVDVVARSVGQQDNRSDSLSVLSGVTSVTAGVAVASLQVVQQNLVLEKSFINDPVAAGDTVQLRYTVRNLDRLNTITSITFSDDLDAALAGLAASSLPTGPCGGGSNITGSSVLTLSGGSLAPEAACTFIVDLAVPPGAAAGAYPGTTSGISGDAGGRPVLGSPAADTLFITASPLLGKAFSPAVAGSGTLVDLVFTIDNPGGTAASDIGFTDNLGAVLSGLQVGALPASGFCGSGSTLTAQLIGADLHLVMADGSLAAGSSCSFTATLQLPVGASAGERLNQTSPLTATVNGVSEQGPSASAILTVVGAPRVVKRFVDDPVAAGDTVELSFTVLLDAEGSLGANDIQFSDDLAAVLPGLAANGLPQSDVCGAGSLLSGSSNLTLTGGQLPAGGSCSFSVMLTIPGGVLPGAYDNVTSNVMANVGGVAVVGAGGTDTLDIAGMTFAKSFVDDPVTPGSTVTLEFQLANTTAGSAASAITFTDDLAAVGAGLSASGLPQAHICGAGSSLSASGNLLIFQGGSLGPGATCTFQLPLFVPASTAAGSYANSTSGLSLELDGTPLVLPGATDALIVADTLLLLTKSFSGDPVAPGDTVPLAFAVENLGSTTVNGLAFMDDLGAALPGLISLDGTLADVCGVGSTFSGSSVLSLADGVLAGGDSCSFSVTLQVPASVGAGTIVNTTTQIVGMAAGEPVTGEAAGDELEIQLLTLEKGFGGPAVAGDTASLTFTIRNASSTSAAMPLSFSDDLARVLPGLTAVGLPQADVCGIGSVLDGGSLVTLADGSVMPAGSCTFSIDVLVPPGTPAGDYFNESSPLLQAGEAVAAAATAILTVVEVVDADGDGVTDDIDACPATVIPESVPTEELRTNRYALVDEDFTFDTIPPNGQGPGASFTVNDTAGCSCEQIIDALGLGNGHRRFGCSLGAMRDWVELVD